MVHAGQELRVDLDLTVSVGELTRVVGDLWDAFGFDEITGVDPNHVLN